MVGLIFAGIVIFLVLLCLIYISINEIGDQLAGLNRTLEAIYNKKKVD